jgi:hypothetical protein
VMDNIFWIIAFVALFVLIVRSRKSNKKNPPKLKLTGFTKYAYIFFWLCFSTTLMLKMFTARVSTSSESKVFKNKHFYWKVSSDAGPKIGHWAQYELKNVQGCEGKHVGQVQKIDENGHYIIKEFSLGCDSKTHGPIKGVNDTVYPKAEVEFLSFLINF